MDGWVGGYTRIAIGVAIPEHYSKHQSYASAAHRDAWER